MNKHMHPLIFLLKNWEEMVCALSVAAMTLLCSAAIISRYAFRTGLAWSTDACNILLIYTSFTGAAAAYKRNMHFGMDFLTERLRPGWQFLCKIALDILLAGMFLFLFYLSAVYTAGSKKLMDASRIPYKYVDFAAVLGFGSMSAYALIFLLSDLKALGTRLRRRGLPQSAQASSGGGEERA